MFQVQSHVARERSDPPPLTRYVYHGDRVIEEMNEAGTALVASYVYGNDIDEVLRMRRDTDGTGGPENYYYHTDDLFNVVALTDQTGAIVERYDYGDYGAPEIYSPAGAPLPPGVFGRPESAYGNTRLFQGRDYDAETGLYYFRARYLDPLTGRFTTRDPLGIWADVLNLGNGYTYAGNNPWSMRDPLGLKSGNKKGLLELLRDEWERRKAIRRLIMNKLGIARWIAELDESVRDSVVGLATLGLLGKTPIEQAEELEPWVPGIGLATRIAQYTGDAAGIVAGLPGLIRSIPNLIRGAAALGKGILGLGRQFGDDLLRVGRQLMDEELGAALIRVGRGGSQAVRASPRALARALEAAGHVRQPGEAVHHIVAGSTRQAAQARRILNRFGIGIDDAANGVFLPGNRAAANPFGRAVHSTIHTKEYYRSVNELLGTAKTRQQAIDILNDIRVRLEAGGFPR